MAKWWKEASAAQRRWIGTFSYEDMGAGKCQSQRRWRQRSTARVTAKIRPGLLRPNPRIFLFADTSGRKHCNPWISHPTKIKKATIFFQVGEGLLIIFLACSNFWKKQAIFLFKYSNNVEAKKTLRMIIFNDFELFRGGLPSQKLPLRSQLSFCSFSLPDKSLAATYFLLTISIIFGCPTTSKSLIQWLIYGLPFREIAYILSDNLWHYTSKSDVIGLLGSLCLCRHSKKKGDTNPARLSSYLSLVIPFFLFKLARIYLG